MEANSAPVQAVRADWAKVVAHYQSPIAWKSVWQIVNSSVPFVVIWYLAYRALEVSYWLTLALAVLAAGFEVRLFIIQHDCGHGSFFKSKTASDVVGSIIGVLTLSPYFFWRRQHAVHHATACNLDRRGLGDVYTMTVREYLSASRWKRLGYRLFRHPLVVFGLGPTYTFVLSHRVPFQTPRTLKRERASVYWTNLALVAVSVIMGLTVGFKEFLLVQAPITLIASTVGVWLFYVQHQFEGNYWARNDQWNYALAALKGASYYKLPKLFQWFTGNIGLHHIHHLSPKTPNYLLQKCYDENPIFHKAALTFRASWKCIFLNLWDEQQQRLVSFRSLQSLPQAG